MVHFITLYIQDIDEINIRLPGRRIQLERWRPSEPPFVKITFYASLKAVGINHVLAKALACLQRVQMGLDLGFKKVVVERDNRIMIKKLQTQRQDDSVINAYIEDSKRAN
ncbi:hypothetical protein Goari_011296 [Gossypium aridum]|uniref:RNase H type-1 domain-containing protein n=1 Tax=Gossypium aridum TaxID=34290 RepID=A0A7J8WWW3_GOSAI|nr:hypothetical protein [Gossypium aridum]